MLFYLKARVVNYCGCLSVSKEIATQIRQCYQFFSWYLLVYMAKKYDVERDLKEKPFDKFVNK